MAAASRGAVTLANAPGNGVADDKAMYCYLPELITYYLGERPLLDPVPTYRCADPDELATVLDRLDQLVTKPVDGYGGGGVLIGPHASDGRTGPPARRDRGRAGPVDRPGTRQPVDPPDGDRRPACDLATSTCGRSCI